MNFAVDLMMMKSMNKDGKNDAKALSTIYDINGNNLFCLNGEAAIKYYEVINFLKENNKESTLENVKRVFDIFLKEYDPFFKLLSPKKYTQSYSEHIEKLKRKRLMQVGMESIGFIYMAYQIFNSMKKLNTTSKFKYIPLIGIIIYIAINVFNSYYANYTKKEYNIVKTLRPRLNDISDSIYVQIPEIQKINSKVSSLFNEMLNNKIEIILKYVDNPIVNKQEKSNNKTNNIIDDDSEIGIEMSKLEEIERQLVPSAFIDKPDLFMEDVAVIIEIESKSDKEEEEINLENIQTLNVNDDKLDDDKLDNDKLDDDKLSVTEEILEEIKHEIEQEEQQKINSVDKKQIEEHVEEKVDEKVDEQVDEKVDEKINQVELKEEPHKKGRRNNTTQPKSKQNKPTQPKSKQTKPKQTKPKK